ncbi:tyrosine-type recombinase/integrase [Endozoicomonas sp. Mp262]|uniref:tyrosine-type recombinase/integrase n=1 Tax=Endozoicomonas sp. Mp262 TaxID=2919499 RepID=UPI0021DAED69
MPRKRKSAKDAWIPPRVYRGKSAYEFHPKGGGAVRLCDLDANPALVIKRWEQERERIDRERQSSLNALCAEFQQSEAWFKLATGTRSDYGFCHDQLMPVFGKMNPDKIKPEHIRKYMDTRGRHSPVRANREKAYLSKVYSWAYERGKVIINPVKGVKKFTETARDRYITDDEYHRTYSAASVALKVAMEISYLCAARRGDVLKLERSQILEEGIFIQQGKTGKKQIKAWTDRLRAAVKLASKIPGATSSKYLIHNKFGSTYTPAGFRSIWNKAKEKAKKEAEKENIDLDTSFTFHDIKAKGISDFEGNLAEKQQFSGHKTQSQVNTYDRKTAVVRSLDKPLPAK